MIKLVKAACVILSVLCLGLCACNKSNEGSSSSPEEQAPPPSFTVGKTNLSKIDLSAYNEDDVIEDFDLQSSAHAKLLGRTHFNEKGELVLRNSCSGFELSFNGSGVTATIKAQGLYDGYFRVYVDGKEYDYVKVQNNNVLDLRLAENLKAGVRHTLRFIKVTEPMVGNLTVSNISAIDGDLLRPIEINRVRFEVYGDSITCGYGALGTNETAEFLSSQEDATRAYAFLTAQHFDADINYVSHQGWALGQSKWGSAANPMCLPAIYDQISDQNKDKWSFDSYTPDVVLINLGTNDSGAVSAHYLAFLKNLRAAYPKAIIVCLSGMMENHVGDEIEMLLEQNSKELANVHYCNLPKGTDGGGYHPDKNNQKAAAEVLCSFLETL